MEIFCSALTTRVSSEFGKGRGGRNHIKLLTLKSGNVSSQNFH